MKLLVPYLFLWTTVLAGLVKPQASAPKLTAKELEYLTDDPEVTHRITFEITHRKKTGLEVLGSLTMALFGTVVPKTAENFAQLSSMTPGYGYEQMIFHRVINNFMIQGGDFEHRRGTGGKLIYDGGKFDDENFELKHNKMGRISMANLGPNTNGAQFFITNVIDLAGLDGKHVVFGQLIGGFDTLVKISTVPVDKNNNMPLEEVFVSNIKVETMQEELKEEATFAASAAVSDQDAPQYEEIDPSSNFYTYFFLILLIGGILFYYNQWHHRKQHVTDIKDSAYF